MTDDVTCRLRKDPHSATLWKQWYEVLFPRLIYQAFRNAHGRSHAVQDAAHDAFIGFLDCDAIKKVRNDEEAVRFLLRLTLNSMSNERRKEARRRLLLHTYEADVPHKHTEFGQDQVTSFSERLETASRVLKCLDDSDRIIILATLRGDTLREISEQIGVSYSAVGVRRHRILKKLTDGTVGEASLRKNSLKIK